MIFFFPGGIGGFILFLLFLLVRRWIFRARNNGDSDYSQNFNQNSNYNNSYNSSYNFRTYQDNVLKTENAYKVLGVSRNADEAEIKKAYRKLILEFHPDTVASRTELSEESKKYAARRFREVQEAYELICNERGIK